jgi:hypothetical protein
MVLWLRGRQRVVVPEELPHLLWAKPKKCLLGETGEQASVQQPEKLAVVEVLLVHRVLEKTEELHLNFRQAARAVVVAVLMGVLPLLALTQSANRRQALVAQVMGGQEVVRLQQQVLRLEMELMVAVVVVARTLSAL